MLLQRLYEQAKPHSSGSQAGSQNVGKFAYTVGLVAGVAGAFGRANGFSSASTFHSPGGVTVDARGSLVVVDEQNRCVRRVLRDATDEVAFLQVCGVFLGIAPLSSLHV